MRCAKCGNQLKAFKCSKCGFTYYAEQEVRYLSVLTVDDMSCYGSISKIEGDKGSEYSGYVPRSNSVEYSGYSSVGTPDTASSTESYSPRKEKGKGRRFADNSTQRRLLPIVFQDEDRNRKFWLWLCVGICDYLCFRVMKGAFLEVWATYASFFLPYLFSLCYMIKWPGENIWYNVFIVGLGRCAVFWTVILAILGVGLSMTLGLS